jgi:hypothetical protein
MQIGAKFHIANVRYPEQFFTSSNPRPGCIDNVFYKY